MAFDQAQFLRVAKHLQMAVGYFELGMTQKALHCLDGLGELGPFILALENWTTT